MAITKLGPPIAGIRGTIGGITYSENKGGTYAKLWAPPVNPRSPNQQTERAYLSRMPGLWRALSDAQRAAWDTFAALPAQELFNPLGESYYASGFGWFCKCNVRLLRMARATIQAVPTQARPAAPTIDGFRVTLAGTESDLCAGGVASADSFFGVGFEADKAFDDNIATKWASANTPLPHWLRYDLAAPKLVLKYTLQSHAVNPHQTPKSWTFEGWTGAAWDVLHTVSLEPNWAGTELRTYYLPSRTTTYSDYRWNVSAIEAGQIVSVAEAQLFLGVAGSSVIVYPEDDFADAPDYDLVLFVSMGRSIGMQVQYPGFYELLTVQSPGRTYEEFQTEITSLFGTILENRSWFARLARQTTQGIRSACQTARCITTGP